MGHHRGPIIVGIVGNDNARQSTKRRGLKKEREWGTSGAWELGSGCRQQIQILKMAGIERFEISI